MVEIKATYSTVKNYLKEIASQNEIRSMFIAGSAKEILETGSDIDVFVVVKEDYLDSFLDKLTKKIRILFYKRIHFFYTYFRGPIKYENKILIHFVIYTDNPKGTRRVQDFQNESPQVFEGILKKYNIILGDDPISIKGEMNLGTISREEREKYMKKKGKEFWENGTVTYSEWKKISKHWVFEHTTIKLSDWQKEHLSEYHASYKP